MKYVYGILNQDYVLLGTANNIISALIIKKRYHKAGFDNIIINDNKIRETKTSQIIIL